MDTCDVIVAGGGPAGSTCACALQQAGFDVVVVDQATFPRDKACAGWITPQVVEDLRLDVADYRRDDRTFQPFTSFRVGMIGSGAFVDATYGRPVSFGIRRREFDTYLLMRSQARLRLGTPVTGIRREGHRWIVNDALEAPMLIGAGGHFCPVARMLNGPGETSGLVVAQEAEFAIDTQDVAAFVGVPERPELYFSRSLDGYGWCVRKQNYLNIGFGHMDRHRLPQATAEFAAFLRSARKIPGHAAWHWKGHAYRVSGAVRRRIVDEGVLLVGDAAGLACPHSGEGIRPAIESGLIAAAMLADTRGEYGIGRLREYEHRVRQRFGAGGGLTRVLPRGAVARLGERLGPRLLRAPWFVRHVLLDRWFLHAHEPALVVA